MGMQKNIQGFTLIEVAIAVLVVSLGVLAVAALFSQGLSASAKAVGDTHSSMFADNVFNGLRARSLLEAEKQTVTNPTWVNFWTNFICGGTSITIAAVSPGWSVWTNVMPIRVGGPYTQNFANIPMHGAGITGLVDHAFRYRIDAWTNSVVFSNLVSAKLNGAWLSPWWTLPATDTTARVVLYVWDNRFGSTNVSDALMFSSEFANQGDL